MKLTWKNYFRIVPVVNAYDDTNTLTQKKKIIFGFSKLFAV